jgi:thymidylate synthase (FAD)
MTALGVPKEDARFILPHGWETSIVITMNARELRHFFELRLCRRAQWEIRETARRMLVLAYEKAAELFDTAGPPCVSRVCTEHQSCGKPYANTEEVMAK